MEPVADTIKSFLESFGSKPCCFVDIWEQLSRLSTEQVTSMISLIEDRILFDASGCKEPGLRIEGTKIALFVGRYMRKTVTENVELAKNLFSIFEEHDESLPEFATIASLILVNVSYENRK
jgi:hypothetical protein